VFVICCLKFFTSFFKALLFFSICTVYGNKLGTEQLKLLAELNEMLKYKTEGFTILLTELIDYPMIRG